jgi:hypothetical protein
VRVVGDVSIEERLGDDGLRQRHHLGMAIERVSLLPLGQAERGVGRHHVAGGRDALSVEGGLDETPLAQPEVVLGEEQAVAEHRPEETHPRALVEITAARHQDVLDDVRMIDQDRATGAEADGDEVAVLACARGIEAELIALQVGQTSEQEVPLRAPWKRPGVHHMRGRSRTIVTRHDRDSIAKRPGVSSPGICGYAADVHGLRSALT